MTMMAGRYEYVARKIADEYVISKASVRARMIQLGYLAATRRIELVDGHYIVPFAFSDIGSCSGDGTYVIDRKSVSLLYRKDKEFKRIMQSGKFAYVDGHVVYCESDNVIHTIYGARLSGLGQRPHRQGQPPVFKDVHRGSPIRLYLWPDEQQGGR